MGRQIKTKVNYHKDGFRLGGWLTGKYTYLWFGIKEGSDQKCFGTLSGYKLYRLAKAIVRHFESPPPDDQGDG
jgi:hypothetical protein